MTINNEQRHAQLQAQMTVCLDSLRRQVASQMMTKIDEMQARPRIKGSEALPTLAGDSRLNRDESGSMLLGAAIGVPGLSEAANMMVDVATEAMDSRQACFARPQDKKALSFKEILAIKEKNKQDMAVFAQLGEKLDLLDTYIASGYHKGAIVNGSLLPLEGGPEKTFEMKTEEKYTADNQNKPKAFAPKFAA